MLKVICRRVCKNNSRLFFIKLQNLHNFVFFFMWKRREIFSTNCQAGILASLSFALLPFITWHSLAIFRCYFSRPSDAIITSIVIILLIVQIALFILESAASFHAICNMYTTSLHLCDISKLVLNALLPQ